MDLWSDRNRESLSQREGQGTLSNLKAGIIGLGVGEQHIVGYRAHSACEVVALCDIDADKRAMAEEKYPNMRVYESADELLGDPGIDVVSIASYDNHHATQVIRAFENAKHVFVEKPLCLHERELMDIRAAYSERPELKMSSNLILRKCPRFVELKRMIAHGVLGQLTFMEAAYNYGRLHKITDGWRGQLDFYSVVHGGAVHMIDLLLWLTGDRIVEVTARGNAIASSGSSFANHDLVTSIAQFESGALANVTANSGCVHPHFHVLNIYGTEATFQNDVPHARLVHSRDPNEPPRSIETEYPGAHKGDLIRGFVDSIVGDMPAEVTAEDVFATMSVSLAIEQASHQSQAVAVQYI